MKYCPQCGKQVVDEAVVCVGCGCALNKNWANGRQDSAGFGWGFLGFLFPIVGLVLYLVWKDERPKRAKSIGIGAIVGCVLSLIGSIFAGVVYGVLIAALFAY